MDFVQQKEGNSFGILGLHLWLHTSSMDRKSEKQDSNKGMKFSTLKMAKPTIHIFPYVLTLQTSFLHEVFKILQTSLLKKKRTSF